MTAESTKPEPDHKTSHLSPDEGAQLRLADAGPGCVIQLARITLPYTGHLLKKDDGEYIRWARDFDAYCTLNGIGNYLYSPPPEPDSTYQPRAQYNWTANDRLTCAFILTGVDKSERYLIPKNDARAAWLALAKRHGGAGHRQQIFLLRDALTTKFSTTSPLTATATEIAENVNRAFSMGSITCDLLISIAYMAALSSPDFSRMRSIVTRDFTSSEPGKYGPTDMMRLFESQQTLHEANKVESGGAIALAAKVRKSSGSRELLCTACEMAGRSYKTHMKEWCVYEGGGMAGKTIEESIAARKARKNKATSNSQTTTSSKSKITITDQNGQTFHVEGDNAFLAACISNLLDTTKPKQEFAGLLTDDIPNLDTFQEEEALEYNAFY